uniref:Probable G-protein coupled receptor 88 n=1 Tax=Esox lucius TaxID=8010 RepID=C1BYJ4_ESOLU|nr:Probable G-protein coupled receptor 88 [Esox lucius]
MENICSSKMMRNDSVQLTGCDVGHNAKISLTALYSLMCLFGTILNLLVVYLVVTFKKLRTASNAFIVNGCVADLLVCAFWMPHEAVGMSYGSPFAAGYQAFKDALLFLGIIVSLLSHSLIAINRYVLITKSPATYLSIYQKRHTEWMISASWLSALGFLLPWITSSQYPLDGCSYLPASAASLLRGGKPILSDSFAAGTLVFTIIGQTVVVLYLLFQKFSARYRSV